MTTLREAAQQALEALEIGYDSAKAEADQYHAAMAGYRPQRHAEMDAEVQQIARAITALKAALAEQREPVACEWPSCGCRVDLGEDWKACRPEVVPPQRPAAPIIKPEIKDDKPVPPPEAQTEAEKVAYCAGWWDALAAERKELLRIAEEQQ